jgi:hypothetical protein
MKVENASTNLVTLARRIEALENAFTVALHSVSTALPTVKSDVIENLNRHAQAYKGKDPAVASATKLLINRIETFNPKIRD